MTFQEKLKALMLQQAISPERLADSVGVPVQNVYQWEDGSTMPPVDKLIELADIFNTSVDTLVKSSISVTVGNKAPTFSDDSPTGEIPYIHDIEYEEPTGEIPYMPDTQADEPTGEIPYTDATFGEDAITEISFTDADIKPSPSKTKQKQQKPKKKNKIKKLRSLIRTFIAASLCFTVVFIGSAAFFANVYSKKHQPVYILVHGLGGSGKDIAKNADSTYWGDGNSISDYMEGQGYEVYEASVGPYSSAWDRACELYAQLTGTMVDYGEAHSKANNHQRYGRTYDKPLFDGWSRTKKINLIGHSFGGTTARLLTYLLAYGDKAERKASGESVSPLFIGGKSSLVKSVTTLCTPHNGSTIYYIAGGFGLTGETAKLIFSVLGITGTTDLMLDQFGIKQGAFDFSQISNFVSSSTDNGFYDISPDAAQQLNQKIKAVRSVYYFSYYCSATQKSGYGNNYLPISDTSAVMKATAMLLGSYDTNKMTSYTIDSSWLDNDGLVNVTSAKFPFTEKHTDFNSDKIRKGVWNVMPVITGDHTSVIGSSRSAEYIHSLYDGIFSLLKGL